MFFPVFADTSPVSMFCVRLVQALVERAYGNYHWIAASSAQDFRRGWAVRSDQPTIVFSDAPDAELASFFARAGLSASCFLAEPMEIARGFVESRGIDALAASRAATLVLASFARLATSPATTVIPTTGLAGAPLDVCIRTAASSVGLAPAAADVVHVVDRLCREYSLTPGDPVIAFARAQSGSSSSSGSTAAFAADLRQALLDYEPICRKQLPERLVWRRSLFLAADVDGPIPDAPFDVTGLPRILTYGPFLHLPAGEWQADIEFVIGENATRNRFTLDVYAGALLNEVTVEPVGEGRFTVGLPFAIEEPREPVQIRCLLARGAIEGLFDLRQVGIHARS